MRPALPALVLLPPFRLSSFSRPSPVPAGSAGAVAKTHEGVRRASDASGAPPLRFAPDPAGSDPDRSDPDGSGCCACLDPAPSGGVDRAGADTGQGSRNGPDPGRDPEGGNGVRLDPATREAPSIRRGKRTRGRPKVGFRGARLDGARPGPIFRP